MRFAMLVAALAMMLVLGACKKKPAPAPPVQPPPPPAPTASISANPTTIEAGQSTTLTWRTENAAEIMIDGLGTVEASGTRSVTPQDSTTYRLVARGAGGTQEATARVTVTPRAQQAPPPPSETEEQAFQRNVQDIFYDYDSSAIRAESQQSLAAAAKYLNSAPHLRFTIEGHCDERGSTEYNLGLGEERANAAKQVLVQAGVNPDRIRTISYGKEKPFCTESNESCWQQNRRAHFVLQR
jgi:peptidoglycan-associated lipoprotein